MGAHNVDLIGQQPSTTEGLKLAIGMGSGGTPARPIVSPSKRLSSTPIGTAVAVESLDSGKRSVSRGASAGRGGFRNRADRKSHWLTWGQVLTTVEAADAALTRGLLLNRFVTIHWGALGVPDNEAVEATGRYIKLLSDWVRSQGSQLACVWVRENDPNKPAVGSHVHILLHLPAGIQLRGRQIGWMRRVTGRPYRKRAVLTRRIAGSAGMNNSGRQYYLTNLAGALRYILKGAEPTVARAEGLRSVPCGAIIGKRCGRSQNLSAGRIRTAANRHAKNGMRPSVAALLRASGFRDAVSEKAATLIGAPCQVSKMEHDRHLALTSLPVHFG